MVVAHHAMSQRAFALRAVVAKLPLERYALLRYLIEFLTDVHAFAHHNQMTSSNLAIVFGPVSGGGRRRVTRSCTHTTTHNTTL